MIGTIVANSVWVNLSRELKKVTKNSNNLNKVILIISSIEIGIIISRLTHSVINVRLPKFAISYQFTQSVEKSISHRRCTGNSTGTSSGSPTETGKFCVKTNATMLCNIYRQNLRRILWCQKKNGRHERCCVTLAWVIFFVSFAQNNTLCCYTPCADICEKKSSYTFNKGTCNL